MWKDWLSFSKSERYGIVALIFLICVVAFLPFFLQFSLHPKNITSTQSEFDKVDSFFRAIKIQPKAPKNDFSVVEEESHIDDKSELFYFDPNTITVQQLVKLGFSIRQAQVIERYRDRGGVFKNASDFAKMYVVDSLMYSKLQSFISIDTVALTETNSNEVKPQVVTPVLVDINSADTLELVKLKGIGRSYARRIIAYRQLLGGFVRAEQLTEIWGFTPEMLQSIQSNIIIDSTQVQLININLVTFQDLKKHPYLTEYQAKAIIYYRETKGNIDNLDEILKNKLVDAVTFKKIKGYMVVN